jgi:hypothetical protein
MSAFRGIVLQNSASAVPCAHPKFERIVMRGRLVFVDLSKDRRLGEVTNSAQTPSVRASKKGRKLFSEAISRSLKCYSIRWFDKSSNISV